MALESIPAPATVLVPVAQLAQMQADQAAVQQMLAQKELEATASAIRATAASGQVEQLARTHRQELETERQRAANVAKQAELTQVLARQDLVPSAVGQLSQLWSNSLIAEPQGNSFAVRTSTYQDVPTFVQEQLSKPEYAHYRNNLPTSAPVNRPSQPGQPATTTVAEEPKNLGAALVANFQAQKQARDSQIAATHSSADMSQSFGLGARRGPAWGSPLFGTSR
jgi:hypothetical protein